MQSLRLSDTIGGKVVTTIVTCAAMFTFVVLFFLWLYTTLNSIAQ